MRKKHKFKEIKIKKFTDKGYTRKAIKKHFKKWKN